MRKSTLLRKTYVELTSRSWYDHLAMYLTNQGYEQGSSDKSVFNLRINNEVMVVQIYFEGIVFGSTCQTFIDQFAKDMTQEFEMSMCGELRHFLGLQVKQSDNGIFVTQSAYANSLIVRFGMEASLVAETPMGVSANISKDEDGETVDEGLYREMIGCLKYLTTSRPDLCLATGICATYQDTPKRSHLMAVQRILKYVKGTANLGMYYSKDTDKFLMGYSVADGDSSLSNQRSTSGGYLFMGNNLVLWYSKKQNGLSLSSLKANYSAIASCYT